MKPKPQPKELVVENPYGRFVYIYTNSEDAKQWTEQEGATFGGLSLPSFPGDHYTLCVTPAWILAEVISHLGSYNDEGD